MTRNELHDLVMAAVTGALEKDSDAVGDALDKIGASGDPSDMYAACCGFAEVGLRALKKIYGDQAPDTATGGMWVMQELKPGTLAADAPQAFSMRFLIAYANDDHDTALALFVAAVQTGGVEYVDSVCALLADVVGLAHAATQPRADR